MDKPAQLAELALSYRGRPRLQARKFWHFDRGLVFALIALSALAVISLRQAYLLLLERDATRQQSASVALMDRPGRHAVTVSAHEVKAATLPNGPEAAAVLSSLSAISRQRGLAIGDISSSIQRETGHQRLRQSFEFQARGSFKAIGGLTAEMLRQHQTLALDSINAERADGDSAIVVASLRFSLFIEP
jgi:hypothetical protein